MSLTAIVLSAGLLASAPAPIQTLVAEPVGGCDVAVQFNPNPKHLSINMGVYGRVTAWLRKNPTRATVAEARWGGDYAGKGGRTLCLTAPTPADTAALYDDVRKLLPKYSPKGRIILQSRFGYRFQTELSSYRPGERMPKDNGIRMRPPIGERN